MVLVGLSRLVYFSKLKPSEVQDWTVEHENAFTELQEPLCVVPALGLSSPSKTFHIQVDTHKNTCSSVLAQEHGGKLRPVAYYSQRKSVIETEFDLCTQQVLAVHWMLTTTEPVVAKSSSSGRSLTTRVRK
uniref:Reverse transcriptase/retrotransposon-derived protein RNase H-like domain-containing protein n=1 Tax=Astyanax mexicanus TaxID=7994 RepID=A0A3B1IY69_ASTMX